MPGKDMKMKFKYKNKKYIWKRPAWMNKAVNVGRTLLLVGGITTCTLVMFMENPFNIL